MPPRSSTERDVARLHKHDDGYRERTWREESIPLLLETTLASNMQASATAVGTPAFSVLNFLLSVRKLKMAIAGTCMYKQNEPQFFPKSWFKLNSKF